MIINLDPNLGTPEFQSLKFKNSLITMRNFPCLLENIANFKNFQNSSKIQEFNLKIEELVWFYEIENSYCSLDLVDTDKILKMHINSRRMYLKAHKILFLAGKNATRH